MRKILSLITILSIISYPSFVFSEESLNPTVNINGFLGGVDENAPTGVSNYDPAPEKQAIIFNFDRFLNKNLSQFDRAISLKQGFETINSYKLLFYKGHKDGNLIKAIYILNTNDKCIGYLILDLLNIANKPYPLPEVTQIKTLTLNPNYLIKKLYIPRNKITFYEQDHGAYIERYGLSDEFFYIDAFYPKELEKVMAKSIIEVLNYNYKYITTR